MEARNRRRQEQLLHEREREERRRARQLSRANRAHTHLHHQQQLQSLVIPGSSEMYETGAPDEYARDVIPSTGRSGSNDRDRMPLGNISVNKVDSHPGDMMVSPLHEQQHQQPYTTNAAAIVPAGRSRSDIGIGNRDNHSIRPLMTIEAAVPSSAMSTLTTPTLVSPSAVLPQPYANNGIHNLDSIHDEDHRDNNDDDIDDENIPPMRTSRPTRTGASGSSSSNVVNTTALVSPDGYSSRRTTSNMAHVHNDRNSSRRSAPPPSSSSSVEQSSIDNNDMEGTRQQYQQQHRQGFASIDNDYDDQSRASSSSDSEMSMLSTALSISGIDLEDGHRQSRRRHDHRRHLDNPASRTRLSSSWGGSTAVASSHNRRQHNNDRELNIHRGDSSSSRHTQPTSQAAVNDLKIRLADTATQLTTVEDELRQRVEVEGSLRFAIDILRNRLNIRRNRDNQRRGERGGTESARSSQDSEEREDIEVVTEMLTELGLSGPPSQQAAQIARQMEDSELRTEGLRSRLAKTEKERTAAEHELRERNQTISELRAELHTVKSKLTIAERRAEKDKAKLEKRCDGLESSKKVLKDELQRFKSQLELVANIKPGNDYDDAVAAAAAAIAASGESRKGGLVDQLRLRQTPSAEEQETLEARAKAKVLLSLQKEADLAYQGSVKEMEAMISQVYKQELKAEIDGAAGRGDNANGEVQKRKGPQQQVEESQQQLSELSTQRLDEVGEDFKLLLSTRDRMIKLHEKIKRQCDSILATSENAAEKEAGR